MHAIDRIYFKTIFKNIYISSKIAVLKIIPVCYCVTHNSAVVNIFFALSHSARATISLALYYQGA